MGGPHGGKTYIGWWGNMVSDFCYWEFGMVLADAGDSRAARFRRILQSIL